ncbi:sister chromatid cohesion protein [Ophiostoma piceae UAMH 11346]|uniref:Sister chromatid cohesion protein n=1 Tax=Ophiostoma piceae (strain UAMH 11346) TaxID=1262450 RepID=S3CBF4_OPHP1|nr:sister chromatid cohesion protein [Ophiostoma piceae UAMH 11346]
MDTQTVTIHPKRDSSATSSTALPSLVQTPAGLALLELQGSFNLPQPEHDDDGNAIADPGQAPVHIGRIEFPDYDAAAKADPRADAAWMRRVQFYVGPNQRLTGEVKKLPRPLAVVRRKPDASEADLEVVEIIHYKLLFSNRPEPMTESGEV